MRAAALVRDNVLKVEYPQKVNFRLIVTLRSPFSMKHTGQRFEGRLSQKVKLSYDFHFPALRGSFRGNTHFPVDFSDFMMSTRRSIFIF